MMKSTYLVILACLLLKTAAASDGDLSGTAVGWSGLGGDLTGIPQRSIDLWTGRSNWNDLEAVGWPTVNAQFMSYIHQYPDGVVNFAVGLIPHDQPSSTWNSLLDEVVAGEHDDVFVAEGQNMAKNSTKTVYCRPWWEMTINVRPLDPTKFKAAWNHAIPIIRSALAAAAPSKTLKIVFCYLPDASGSPAPYFPDPANFDVVDADIYGKVWGTTTPTQAAMLAEVTKELNEVVTYAAQYNKGIGVSEWGNFAVQAQGVNANQGRGDDPEYIDVMLSFAAQHHFLYMVYYNIAAYGIGQTFADIPLSLAHFRAALTPQPQPAATSPTTTTTTSPTPATSSPTTTTTSTTTTTGASLPAITSFSGWQTRYFTSAQLANPAVSGPMADPYGSGIPNLLAYALQLDPATAQPSDVPQPTPGNGHLIMSYQVPSVLTEVDFVPEVSSDLHTWNSGSAVVRTVSNTVGPNGTTITVEDCLPATTTTRFMRLRVTQQ
jgi:hypothetical protein